MKQLWNRLLPFATDSTGVCSIFCDSDSVVIGHDPGATVLRCYGFTEKREDRRAAYEGMRISEMCCVMGSDEELMEKYRQILQRFPAKQAVFVGTPVAALLGIDLKGLAARLEKEKGLPVLAFPTTGNRYYDKGMSEAFLVIYERLKGGGRRDGIRKAGTIQTKVNLLGLNSLDFPWESVRTQIRHWLQDDGCEIVSVWGTESDPERWMRCSQADKNIVCSVSGLAVAEKMKNEWKIPYATLDEYLSERLGMSYRFDKLNGSGQFGGFGRLQTESQPKRGQGAFPEGISILIIGEQVLSSCIRLILRKRGAQNVHIAGFFIMESERMEEGDVSLSGEDDLEKLLRYGGYDLIISDPLFQMFGDVCPDSLFFPIVHPPVSGNYGRLYSHWNPGDADTLKELCRIAESLWPAEPCGQIKECGGTEGAYRSEGCDLTEGYRRTKIVGR